MRPEVIITFDGNDVPGGVEAMLAAIGCGPDVRQIEYIDVLRILDVDVTLVDTDERLPRLVERLDQLGVNYGRGHHDRYTDEDLDNARLIFMDTYYECEVAGGGEFGTTYDFTGACPGCGAGARQRSALFLDGDDDELPKLQGHRAALRTAGRSSSTSGSLTRSKCSDQRAWCSITSTPPCRTNGKSSSGGSRFLPIGSSRRCPPARLRWTGLSHALYVREVAIERDQVTCRCGYFIVLRISKARAT